jgi:predicted nucleic acid-binding protein
MESRDVKMKYYLDSCIWRDHFENRFGPQGRPLGHYATKLMTKLIKDRAEIVFTDTVVDELEKDYAEEDVLDMFNMLFKIGVLKRVEISREEFVEAKSLSVKRTIPFGDALHTVIAKNNDAVLVSQDNHFERLKDIVKVIRPEDII